MGVAARLALAVVAASLLLSGCAASEPAAKAASVRLPPVDGIADYQLGGAYAPDADVTIVTRDSTAKPAPGVYSICYINGFQTQPDVAWPSDLILHTGSGAPLVDANWPDEHIIDISTAAKRESAAARIHSTVRECAKKGFDAVEFDNLDSYTRSRHALTKDDAIRFATLLVEDAHSAGLAAGQKNTSQLGSMARSGIGFDFAVAEECDQFSECGAYTKVYGKHVIDIEYTDELRRSFSATCAAKSTPASTILRDRDLTVRGDPAYAYSHC